MLVAWESAAWASPQVASRLDVQKVVVESGHDVLKPAGEAKPGDVLQYRAIYSNKGDAPADKLIANLPVPQGTTLQANGSDPAGAQASVDGKNFGPMPLMRSVTGKDGKPHREPVPMAEIRALRWQMGTLAPQQDRIVQLRVRIDAPNVTTIPDTKPAKPVKR